MAQFTVSWMYDQQGLKLAIDAIGPGFAIETTRSDRRSSDARTSGSADPVVGDYQVECEADGVTRQIVLAVRQGLPPGGG